MFNERVAAHLRSRHGVISNAEAVDLGLTQRQVGYRVATGEWIRIARGVYRNAAAVPTWRSELLIAVRAAGGLASHRSAACLHRIEGFGEGRRDVTVRHGNWAERPGVTLHQSTQLGLADPTVIDHIPCTGLARTVLDLAGVVSENRLQNTVDVLLRERRIQWTDLLSVLVRHARRGRNGVGPLRQLLDERFGEKVIPLSQWSRMVATLLVDSHLDPPVLEHRVLRPDGSLLAQVDLAYPAERVAIELDSVRWHLNRTSFVTDRRRYRDLTLAGWTVLAFTWTDYVDTPWALVADVRAARRAAAQAS